MFFFILFCESSNIKTDLNFICVFYFLLSLFSLIFGLSRLGVSGSKGTKEALHAAKVVLRHTVVISQNMPVMGAAATMLLQMIDLCDEYKCSKELFRALQARMEYIYNLYFGEGGERRIFEN
jgi:hypothetical protein